MDRAGIAALIPHAGCMCLIDKLTKWDAATIRCVTNTHRDATNPLIVAGTLGILVGIEYAAQAMAIHGTLIAATGYHPQSGYLVSVRIVDATVACLDDLPAALEIEARLLAGEGLQMSYEFTLLSGGTTLLTGRATVMLTAAAVQAQAGL